MKDVVDTEPVVLISTVLVPAIALTDVATRLDPVMMTAIVPIQFASAEKLLVGTTGIVKKNRTVPDAEAVPSTRPKTTTRFPILV